MDVRSSGIAQLSRLLLLLYNKYKTSHEGFEHPILQYVGRFMRQNELTRSIFNPDTPASLVSLSQHIIGFLAATMLYTEAETDVIWNACTTSVEAEFVKASFGVLSELCRYLDLDHLLYLARKFAETSPNKLGKDAVYTLSDLFQKVQLRSGDTADEDQERRLTTAFVSLDILYKANDAEDTFSTKQLCDTARIELLRFATPKYNAHDRLKIYQRCVPKLLQPADGSTTSIDIILLFLDSAIVCKQESQDLLGLLSVGTLVDELSYYVKTCQPGPSRSEKSINAAIHCRIEAIIRLLALPVVSNSEPRMQESTLATFTDCAVGRLAISNAARNCAWRTAAGMGAFADAIGSTANGILAHWLKEANALPSEILTPIALHLQGNVLRRRSEDQILRNHFSLVLQDDTWKQLVRTAESTACPATSGLARDTLCDVLFDYPVKYSEMFNASQCHADFARQQIYGICGRFQALARPPGEAEIQNIIQRIDLLAEVLRRSKQSADAFKISTMQEISLIRESPGDLLHCTLQVYGAGQVEAKTFRLHFDASTKLAELASRIPGMTGANANRLIIGGQEMDCKSQADLPMFALGIGDKAGVIYICPKHTLQSDIRTVLTPTGEVEKQLVAQYDQLEKLLDGPEEIAQKVLLSSFDSKLDPSNDF
jgi:ubiquitin carboxyl-terminal hydrolase 34